MADAYFAPSFADAAVGRYESAAATGGPWDPRLQHGGPPTALLVRAAERLAAAEAGRNDLIALRIAAEFVGPVPVGAIETSARVVRAARSGVLVEARLTAGDRPCLDARVWLVRDADTTAVAPVAGPAQPPRADLPGLGFSFPYSDSIEWRAESGALTVPGPAVMWARPLLRLVADEELTGLQRAALVGDSASGVSAELSWDEWSFLNVDLDVHLARPVVGDWIRLDAATQLGGHGAALARSTLSDERGPFGCTAQTLILAARGG